jgi:Holliday junction resolvase RusA-like endonuclease
MNTTPTVYTIEFDNVEIKSKKNLQVEGISKKTGKKYRYYKKEAQASMDSLCLQIPGHMRDLKLEHPDIEIRMTVPNRRIDRDSVLVTILDVLKKMRVIREDNVAHCNGRVTIYPAQTADYWFTEVKLITEGS